MSRIIPDAVAQWPEPPRAGLFRMLASLTPYLRADGYWEFASPANQPVGSTPGAMVRTGGYAAPTTSTTTGLRITRNAAGFVYFY